MIYEDNKKNLKEMLSLSSKFKDTKFSVNFISGAKMTTIKNINEETETIVSNIKTVQDAEKELISRKVIWKSTDDSKHAIVFKNKSGDDVAIFFKKDQTLLITR